MILNNLDIFNELSELVMLRINGCNEVAHPINWIESKNHKDYDLWYVEKGQVEIRIKEDVFLASEGDLILFTPKVTYTATTIGGAGCKFIYTHFELGLGNNRGILDNFQLSGIIENNLVKKELLLFLDTYNEYKQSTPMSGIRLKGCLTILIAKIMEHYGLGDYRGGFINNTPAKKNKDLSMLMPVFDFIHENLHQSLRIGDLAVKAGMSEKYFISYFKQSLGVTPGRYIYQLKMNRARELLYGNRYSIKQISSMLGFPDPYSFSKAFKKYYKVPPSQFW